MEYCWNNIGTGEPKYVEKTLSHCPQCATNSAWTAIRISLV